MVRLEEGRLAGDDGVVGGVGVVDDDVIGDEVVGTFNCQVVGGLFADVLN